MAGRFMRIKKIIIPFITLVILTSQLAGCATLTSQEMIEEMETASDVAIEWAVPDSGPQDIPSITTVRTTDSIQETDIEAEDEGMGMIDAVEEIRELSGSELNEYFKLAYDSGSAIEGDIETKISSELNILVSLVDADGTVSLPGDYVEQYRAWRPAEEVKLFEDCNETVYATGTVNIRASHDTDSFRIGSLSAGESITRIGRGLEGTEAEGWSQVELLNGTVAYISSNYLSTTKPAVQQQPSSTSKPATQQTQNTPATSNTPTSPSSSSTSGSSGSYGDDLTPEQYAEIERQIREQVIQNGGTIITDQRDDTISDSEREYIGTILNGGGAQYNP